MTFTKVCHRKNTKKKYSNKLSMKALAGWIYVLVDSIFRIETVLEWVFQQVIHRRSYVLLSRHVDEMEKMSKWINMPKKDFGK